MARRLLTVRVDLGTHAPARLAALCDLAAELENSPAEGIWLAPSRTSDAPEPLVVLGALSAVTERLELAEAPSLLARRPPSLTAKYVSSLDVVSNGRALCLLGPGDEQIEAFAEALEVVRALLRTSAPSFHGAHFSLEHAHNEPRSAARPVPLGLVLEDAALAAHEIGTLVRFAARFADLLVVGPEAARSAELGVDERRSWLHRAGRLLDDLEVRMLVPAGSIDPSALVDACERLQVDGIVLDAGLDPETGALIGELELLADR